jgi:hypothetical protein
VAPVANLSQKYTGAAPDAPPYEYSQYTEPAGIVCPPVASKVAFAAQSLVYSVTVLVAHTCVAPLNSAITGFKPLPGYAPY